MSPTRVDLGAEDDSEENHQGRSAQARSDREHVSVEPGQQGCSSHHRRQLRVFGEDRRLPRVSQHRDATVQRPL